jgi:quinol monooxygenase YgiN
MTDQSGLAPAAVLISYRVADFDAWKATFDALEHRRVENGFVGHHINRAQEDPNSLTLFLAVADTDRAKAFSSSDELKESMKKAGAISTPEVTWVTPVRENIVWNRELPAFVVTHHVADFDAWLAGYDAAGEVRNSSGIVGDAANRSIDDPSLAVVYHQAESFDTLQSFLESEDLKAAMKEAGVVSEPQATFYAGGWGKQY